MNTSPTPLQIKLARLNALLSQAQAARLINRTMASWHLYESGKLKMDVALWERFLNELNITEAKND